MLQVSTATDEFIQNIQRLSEYENLSRVERVIDLQSKGSQTDSSSSDYQNDWHETFLSDNDLKLAKIKVIELESNSKKEEVIKNGLLEKVSQTVHVTLWLNGISRFSKQTLVAKNSIIWFTQFSPYNILIFRNLKSKLPPTLFLIGNVKKCFHILAKKSTTV